MAHNGLRIWHCHKLWCILQIQLGSGVAVSVVQASAEAPIQPLTQELPHTADAISKQKNTKKTKQTTTTKNKHEGTCIQA